jgi:hypothetical protein
MRLSRTFATLAASSLLVGGLAVAAAPAASATSAVTPATGVTTVTTAKGLAPALISKGIVPYGLGDTSTRFLYSWSNGLQVRYGFPVTGLTSDGNPAAGLGDANVLHSGGLAFANVLKGTRVTTRNYTIDVSGGVITANVAANGTALSPDQIPVYKIDLSGATVSTQNGVVQISGVVVKLNTGIAGALNGALKTTVFTEGATIGTANVRIG